MCGFIAWMAMMRRQFFAAHPEACCLHCFSKQFDEFLQSHRRMKRRWQPKT